MEWKQKQAKKNQPKTAEKLIVVFQKLAMLYWLSLVMFSEVTSDIMVLSQ